MVVTESRDAHVVEFDCPFAAAKSENIAMDGMKLCGRDDFGKFFHINRFDIDNIWGLLRAY